MFSKNKNKFSNKYNFEEYSSDIAIQMHALFGQPQIVSETSSNWEKGIRSFLSTICFRQLQFIYLPDAPFILEYFEQKSESIFSSPR